jgi:hypothetical protein
MCVTWLHIDFDKHITRIVNGNEKVTFRTQVEQNNRRRRDPSVAVAPQPHSTSSPGQDQPRTSTRSVLQALLEPKYLLLLTTATDDDPA